MRPSPPILGGASLRPGLLERAHGAAGELAARGVSEGSRIAVDSRDVLPWFLGADLLGAATLVVESAWTPRERRAVFADARPEVVVTGSPSPTRETVTPHGDGRTHFYLPTTSGSGGLPKVLLRTRESWSRSFRVLGLSEAPHQTVLIPGPLSSSLFLFGALHALYSGHQPRLLGRWHAAEAARACRTAHVVHLVPAMLSALLGVLAAAPAVRAECRLRTIVCGGSGVGDELRERLGQVLPDCELIEYYGSAEHSLIAIRREGDSGLRPVPGVEVAIRDQRVWVRSPLTFSGRLVDGVLLRPASSGWSTVDDNGALRPDGTLTVRGRASSAIVASGGKIVSAEEVEAVLRRLPGVVDVLVAGTPHARFGAIVTAIIEIDVDTPPRMRDLRAGARDGLEPGKRPRRWLAMKTLPRTASGKPARAAAIEQLLDGTLPAAVMT